jgi:hypothetical protein
MPETTRIVVAEAAPKLPTDAKQGSVCAGVGRVVARRQSGKYEHCGKKISGRLMKHHLSEPAPSKI